MGYFGKLKHFLVNKVYYYKVNWLRNVLYVKKVINKKLKFKRKKKGVID